MVNPIGIRVTLPTNKTGTVASFHFGNSNPSYGPVPAGQPVFTLQMDDGSILNNVPLSALTEGG